MANQRTKPHPQRRMATAAPLSTTPPVTDADIAAVERRYQELRRRDPGRPPMDAFREAVAPLVGTWFTTPAPPTAA